MTSVPLMTEPFFTTPFTLITTEAAPIPYITTVVYSGKPLILMTSVPNQFTLRMSKKRVSNLIILKKPFMDIYYEPISEDQVKVHFGITADPKLCDCGRCR